MKTTRGTVIYRTMGVISAAFLFFTASNSNAVPIAVSTLPQQARSQFSALSPAAQSVALDQLNKMGNFDAARTRLDHTGRFFIVEDAVQDGPGTSLAMAPADPTLGMAAAAATGLTPEGVPIFHSLPGSPNVIYLNFLGGHIAGTAWNDNYGLAPFDALPYNLDGVAGLSASEQGAIANIWRRVAEDYSPWQVDVTTERPANFTTTTLMAMITKHISATNTPLPSSYAGGVAYLDLMGFYDAAYYRPAFIYYDNLSGGRENVVAEATSHELGHNFGLSHDGIVNGTSYYMGAGSGATSWGPIMGAAYYASVSKFNNGDYTGANNKENDLEIISSRVPIKVDDVPNTADAAIPLVKANGAFTRSGLMESYTDIDMFSIDAVTTLTVNAKPFMSATNTVGNNVDLALELLDAAGNRIAFASPDDSSLASVSATNLAPGKYFIKVTSVGNPVTPYSAYGGMGQYEVSGTYTYVDPIVTIYTESMASYPSGWTVNIAGAWSYGRPSSPLDPKDANVVGNNLIGTGLYSEPLAQNNQLISKGFSTVGFTSVTLSFDRFLGVQSDDFVSIHGCAPAPVGCVLLWINGTAVIDTAWRTITLRLPTSLLGIDKVQIRFGIGPTRASGTGAATNSFGWNIKNMVITGKH